jgi:hypothetical protein
MNNIVDRYARDIPEDKLEDTLFKIFDDLMDRQGFSGWWGNIDSEIQNEILDSLKNMMKENLA